MNNILDFSNPENQRFIGSVLCVLCENSPVTIRLEDIDKYFSSSEIQRLQYDMVSDSNAHGVITFSLMDKND